MLGETLLHYRLLEKLGEGGMGAVYRAHDSRLGRDVAIKLLPGGATAGGPDQRARLTIEAKAAAALNHPNIATVHAIEEVDDHLFIVMEYVDGQDLKAQAASHPLDTGRIMDIAVQIAAGLEAAHAKGIVHRDIKPSNVMVTADGTVKITDFGLARIGIGTDLTETGAVLGTVSYMSPEQVRGEAVDHRSDIWSFGVILYELFGRQRPFDREDLQATLFAILSAEPPPLSRLSPATPERAERIVRKALEKNREARYQRMADMMADLKAVRGDGRATAASTSSPSKKDPRPKLAVLPFSSIRSDPEMSFLGFALADQIIGSLSHITRLLVRPSIAIRKYLQESVDAPAVGRDLQVDFVLTGNYLKEGDVIRLNVELVDTGSNEIVWRAFIEDTYQNAFKLQDAVSKKVLRGLKVRFSAEEQHRMQADVPGHPLAYEYYLRGVSYPLTVADDQLAIEMFQKSIELDPRYPPAHVELGVRLNHMAYEARLGHGEHMKAEAAFRQALSLNPNLLSALSHLSFQCVNAGRSGEAVELIARMFEIDADHAVAHFALGYLYRYTGMLDESVREVERALSLDPRNPRFRSAGFTFIYRGDYRRAFEVFDLDQSSTLAAAWKGMARYFMGDTDEALAYLDRAAAMDPESFVGLRHAGIAALLRGQPDAGLRHIRRLEETMSSDVDAEHWYLVGTAYSLLGEREGCLRGLQRAVAGGFFCYPAFLSDPSLDAVRELPEFQPILTLARESHEAFRQRLSAAGGASRLPA